MVSLGRVTGKVCIVTGGAMGIGKAEAEALADEGAHVIVADIDEAAGAATAVHIGKSAVFLPLDVRIEDNWRAVVGSTLERFGRLDVLVNNAAIIEIGDVETCTLDSWRRVSAVSVEGSFLGVKHALPAMRSSGGGSIINTSSSAALQGVSIVPAYGAAKAAVAALTRTVAVHCIERGYPIRCNVIHPHNIETPMMHGIVKQLAGDLPDGPPALVGAPPMSVAKTVVFLASDESSDLNGAAIVLDRGATCIPSA